MILPEALNRRPSLVAGFSTRLGGESREPYHTLNLGLSTGDDPEVVTRNRARLFGGVGIGLDKLAVPGQVHGDAVRVVDAPGLYPGFDGLVTTGADLALCIVAADCAAVLVADDDAGIIAACHSGWRGTRADIVSITIEAMLALGARPARIQAFVSPSIGRDHFEVGEEVAAEFAPAYVHVPDGAARPHLDLKAAIRDQLLEAGVPHSQIEVSPFCTYARNDLFFSYRAERGRTGRMMGFLMRR